MERRHARRPSRLDQDLDSIRGGIGLVASRQADRVVLAGLRYGERLLPRAMELAAGADVDVRPDRIGGGPLAIIVSRPAPDTRRVPGRARPALASPFIAASAGRSRSEA
jgi:hypothetical protein